MLVDEVCKKYCYRRVGNGRMRMAVGRTRHGLEYGALIAEHQIVSRGQTEH